MALLIRHKAQLDYPLHDVRGKLDAETFRLTCKQAQARLASGGHLMFDCSGCVTCIYKWAGLSDPNGLDYHVPTNKMMMSVNYPTGEPHNFELVNLDGTRQTFSAIHGLTDEVYMAIARDVTVRPRTPCQAEGESGMVCGWQGDGRGARSGRS